MRPMYDMLTAAAHRRAFHMPGHKGHSPFEDWHIFQLDTTELPITDDLYSPERAIFQAQRLYAQAAGAGETVFLHNGSTAGIHVLVQLYAKEGDSVILPRNAHLSASAGCVLGGVRAHWIPLTRREDGYAFITEEAVLEAIRRHPEAKAVLLTRPDFYGVCLPLERIVALAHQSGMKVVVDEAHGAHLPWMENLPSAGALGVDAWTQSVHKTLPGLTGTAVLHLKNPADHKAALRILRREQTSSPSFPLLLSIDDSRAYMEENGRAKLRLLGEKADEVRRLLPELGYQDAHALWRSLPFAFDPTRLVIEAPQGGERLARQLAEKGIDVEMHDDRRCVFILSVMDEMEALDHLVETLRTLPMEKAVFPAVAPLPPLPAKRMELRGAAMADTEDVPLEKAAGRIAGCIAGLYPPGIPLICPGEEISFQHLEQLIKAGHQGRFGIEGDSIACLKQSFLI